MTSLSDISFVSKTINDIVTQNNLAIEIQNLQKGVRVFSTNPAAGQQQIFSILDKISTSLASLNTGTWSADQEKILTKLDIDKLVGQSGAKYFIDIKQQLQNTPSSASAIISSVIAEINKIRTKPVQLYTLLQPFELPEITTAINGSEGIIEITFDGKVRIDDFGTAKEQIEEWFLIIMGYSNILNVRREDFQIISISKSSPTKFKIKTSLKNTALVLGVITSVLLIEKTILENKLMIEKLKQNPIVSDSAFHQEYIEKAVQEIEKKIQLGIDEIVDKKMEENKISDGNGDIKNSFSKGVEYQYNFVINGGDVKIHVNNGEVQKQVDTLEKSKNELKQIKESYENQKALNEHNDSISTE